MPAPHVPLAHAPRFDPQLGIHRIGQRTLANPRVPHKSTSLPRKQLAQLINPQPLIGRLPITGNSTTRHRRADRNGNPRLPIRIKLGHFIIELIRLKQIHFIDRNNRFTPTRFNRY